MPVLICFITYSASSAKVSSWTLQPVTHQICCRPKCLLDPSVKVCLSEIRHVSRAVLRHLQYTDPDRPPCSPTTTKHVKCTKATTLRNSTSGWLAFQRCSAHKTAERNTVQSFSSCLQDLAEPLATLFLHSDYYLSFMAPYTCSTFTYGPTYSKITHAPAMATLHSLITGVLQSRPRGAPRLFF